MEHEEILRQIAPYTWYQTIPLGGGLATPGKRSPRHLWRKLDRLGFPAQLAHKSVLDIGCKEGFFAIEAARRGAARVLGIDISAEAEEKFMLVKSITGHAAEFRRMSVFDLDPATVGIFDVVLFLSVFHHLRHPFLGLDKVASVTGEMALMEIYALDDDAAGSLTAMARGFGRSGAVRLLPTRRFLVEALERAGFSKVEITGHTSQRTFEGIPGEVKRVTLQALR